MSEAGIYSGDVLVVDKSMLPAKDGDIVIASVLGEFLVKELRFNPTRLIPRNDNYPVIEINEFMDLDCFGVVVSVVRNVRALSMNRN